MSTNLPRYYFRTRENGATVFRVDTENPQRRIEMQEIAVVNIRNDKIRPHGTRDLTNEDNAAIAGWIKQRTRTLATRDLDDIFRTVDHLNLTAHWAQTRADDNDLESITDTLLLAMHDLRSVLVRRKSDRLQGKSKDDDD